MFKKFNFELRVSRTTNNANDPQVMLIEIQDKDNGSIVFLGHMTIEQFALSILGTSGFGKAEINDDNVGKKYEWKEEFIVTNEYNPSDERIKELVAPYEVDGWSARAGDMGNHHRFKRNGFSVIFSRYVSVEEQ